MFTPLRSLLFCPASRPDRVKKAMRSGADAVIIDLEDAVALAEKENARRQVPELVTKESPARVYVRVNGVDTPYAFPDLMAVVWPGLDGIMLPKVEEPYQVQEVGWVLTALERERGMEAGRVEIIPLVETAAGVMHAEAIGRADSRVGRLAFGFLDFTLDINLDPASNS